MTPLPWLILSFVLSPVGYFYIDYSGTPNTISLLLASSAVSAAVIGSVFAFLKRRHHLHAVIAFMLSTFLLITNIYFLIY